MERSAKTLHDRVFAGVGRVEASATFTERERSKRLLRYLVESTLRTAPRPDDRVIAWDVLGRSNDEVADAAAVLVEIASLRRLLDQYYSNEGRADPLRIELPDSGYPAVFHPSTFERPVRRRALYALAAILVAVVVSAITWSYAHKPQTHANLSTLVVFPLFDESPTGTYGFLAEGLSRDLARDLSAVPGMRILPHTVSLPYQTASPDLQRIRDGFAVNAVIQGTLRVERERARVSVQLTSTQQGFQSWNATYERSLNDVAQLQTEISQAVASALRRDAASQIQIATAKPPANSKAYLEYLRGANLEARDTVAAREVIQHFETAVGADSQYALAWAGLARMYTLLAMRGEARPTEILPRAAEAAHKAGTLSAGLAESQQALARTRVFSDRDWKGAEEELRPATDSGPSMAEIKYDYARFILIPTSRFADAVDQLRAATILDPTRPEFTIELANCFVRARRYDEAQRLLNEANYGLEQKPQTLVLEGLVSSARGNHEDALLKFEQAAKLNRSAWVLGHIGYTLAQLNRHKEALRVIAELEQLPAGKAPPDYDVAAVHAAVGEQDYALAELERARDNLLPQVLWVNVDQRFDNLRRNSRFARLLRSMGLQ